MTDQKMAIPLFRAHSGGSLPLLLRLSIIGAVGFGIVGFILLFGPLNGRRWCANLGFLMMAVSPIFFAFLLFYLSSLFP